jgi:hypothetical protein
MTIEITKPETEALIQQCLQSGQFHDIDELLTKALGALQEKEPAMDEPRPAPARGSLREVFEAVRGLADDVDFSRNPSTGRAVDLS